MDRDVGGMGEAEVEKWVRQVGLVANRSLSQDATGWDYFIQWPQPKAATETVITLPRDRQPTLPHCFVQVKSTDIARTTWSDVRLSNWLYLVENPLPCFFLILEYEYKNDCQRASLVHVGRSLTHDVLERVRQLEAKHGVGNALPHKHDMALKWGKGNALDPLNGEALKRRIEETIGADFDGYVQRKIEARRSVGYEKGGKRINTRVGPPRGWAGDRRELMLDFQLGLLPYLEFAGGEIVDTRFGIPSPEPGVRLTTGRFEAEPLAPIGRARVRLRIPQLDKELGLEMAVRVASGAAGGDPSRVKARFSAPYIDLVWRYGSADIGFTLKIPDPREPQPIGQMQPLAELIALLDAAAGVGAAVDLDLRYKGEPFGTGRLNTPATIVQPQVEWANLVRFAWAAAKEVDLPGDVPVAVAALARYRDPLSLMWSMLRPAEARLRVDVTITAPIDTPELPWCFPLAAGARIGSHVVLLAGGIFGQPALVEDADVPKPRYRLETGDVRVEIRKLYTDPEKPDRTHKELVTAIADRYKETMNVIILEDEGSSE